jgi:hypothetical protein
MPAAPCRVLTATWSRIVCQTEPAGHMHAGAIPGRVSPVEVSVNGIYAHCLAAPSTLVSPLVDPSQFIAWPQCSTECETKQPALTTASDPSTGSSYGSSGLYRGTYSSAADGSESLPIQCCNDDEDEELGEEWGLDLAPLAFMGNNQRPGQQDSCVFWYTAFATPVISNFTRVLTPNEDLLIEGAGAGHDSMRVFLAPFSGTDGIKHWHNVYREAGDPVEPVILPDLEGNADVHELVIYDRILNLISATLPSTIEAGQYLPILYSSDFGAATYANLEVDSDPIVSILPSISSVSPSSLPAAGGYVTLSGAAFPSDTKKIVLKGYGVEWQIVSSNTSHITAFATNLNQWGSNFTIHLLELPGHSAACQADACQLNVETEPMVQAGDYRQLSAGADVSLTLLQMNTTVPDFWSGIKNDGAVYILLDNGLKVFPSLAVNGNTALLMVSTSALPASEGNGHFGVVYIDGYGVARSGSEAGLLIQVPVSVTGVSTSSGVFLKLLRHEHATVILSC